DLITIAPGLASAGGSGPAGRGWTTAEERGNGERYKCVAGEPGDVSTISIYQEGSTLAGPQRPSVPVREAWIAPPMRSPLSGDTRYTSTEAPVTGRLV